MQLFTSKRSEQTNKNKETSPQNKEEDIDLNQYQHIFSIFTHNINTIIKNNKNCFGQMDTYPKYRVSKQVQSQSQNLLPNMYMRILHKLLKEGMGRNTIIMKTREQYQIYYYTVFEPPSLEHKQIKQMMPTVSQLKRMLVEQQRHNKAVCSKDYRSKTISTINNTQDKYISPISVFKSFQVDLSSVLLSKITQNQNQPKECFVRTTRSNISRTQRHRLKNSFLPQRKRQSLPLHQHNQTQIDSGCILINCKQFSLTDKEWDERQKPKLTSGHESLRTSHRIQGKRLSFNQEQTINDIESYYQRTNNINLFRMNPKELCAYKPKTKRWLRNFN